MGVSAVGQGLRPATVRHVVATLIVFAGVFVYFYGPPLTPNLSGAARHTCNDMVGGKFRNFALEWRTTTYGSIDAPHWVCYDLEKPGHPGTSLGWWAGF